MSYTFLLEQVEASSVASFSDIPVSVLSKLNLTAEKCCYNGSGTESCQSSQSGRTCEHLTASRGAEKLMLSAAGSRAKTSAAQGVGKELTGSGVVCGEKWPEWFAKYDQPTSSWKIRQLWLFEDLDESLAIWPKWGTMLGGECLELETPGGCTNAIEFGLLHLPTIGKNEYKGSSRRRYRGSPDFRGAKMSEGLRICEQDPIYTNPDFAEITMNFPAGWTGLRPLETHKMQQWFNSHGKP